MFVLSRFANDRGPQIRPAGQGGLDSKDQFRCDGTLGDKAICARLHSRTPDTPFVMYADGDQLQARGTGDAAG